MSVDYSVFPIAQTGVVQYDYLKLSDTQGVCSAHDGFFITDGNEAVNNSINYCGTQVGLGEAFNGMCYCGDSNAPFVSNNMPITIKSVRLVSPSVYSTETMPYAINGGQTTGALSFLNRNVLGNKRFVVSLDPHAFIYYVKVLLFDRQYLTQGTQYPTISIPYDDFTADNYSDNLITNGYDDNYICIGFEIVCYHGMTGTTRTITNYPVLPEIEFDFPPSGTEHRIMYGGIYQNALADWYAYAQKRQATGAKTYYEVMANWYGGYARSNYRHPCVLTNRLPPDTTASTNTYINMSQYPAESDAGVYDGYMICNWSGVVTFAPVYNKDKIQQMLSITGLFWTGDETTAISCDLERAIPDNVHIGEMVDGITTGVTLSGLDCRDTEQFDYDDIINQTVYDAVDPSNPPAPTPSDDDTDSGGDDIRPSDWTNIRIGAANNFVTLYGMTAASVADFGRQMWANLADPAFWQMVGTAFTNDFSINPADMMKYFISLRYFPFDVSDFAHTTATGIYVGRAATPIAPSTGVAHPIRVTNNVVQVDGGRLTISRYYNDFRDYEPCTTVQIHVPFCGSVDVPASEVMGHEMDLTYKIDLQTGAMLAVLGVASNTYYVIATLAGTCCASIPITANNNIEFLQRIATVGGGLIGGGISGAVKGATVGGEVGAVVGAVAGTVGGGVGALAGLPPVTVHKQGNASGFANLGGVPYAYATVQRGRFERPANYGHTTGFACDFSATLGSLSGFTVCDNVDTSGLTCNADERDEIKRLLESGVYV